MDICGANFSTAACPQQCLSPVTAFQLQNLPACIDEMNAGNWRVVLNITQWNPISEIFDDCMRQYCSYTDQSVGGCPYHGISLSFFASDFDADVYGDTDQLLCKNVDNKVNPDIGGIGVIASYIMQACISMFILLALRLIALLGFCLERASRITPAFKSKLVQQEAVLKSIAVEFQEAQCFFMLACQSAVFAVIRALAKDPQFLGTQTMRAVNYNLAMARLVCIGGILPVTFGLYIIHITGMSSLFICALSGLTIILAISGLVAIPKTLSSASLSPLPYQSKLDKCGQNAPPVVYCQGIMLSEPQNILMITFCTGVYFGILGIVITTYVESKASHSLRKRRNTAWFYIAKIRKVSSGISVLCGLDRVLYEINFLIWFIVYFLQFRPFWIEGAIDPFAWSFGQIVAVTIWVPVITKYLHWSTFGMDGHSAVHIAAPYQITKDKSGYQKTKQVRQDDEAATSAISLTSYHDPLHLRSQDRMGEEEGMIFPQRTSGVSLLHSRTY